MFATQVEALRRLRSGGSQFVRVEHVHVNDGGCAIVGNVSTGQGLIQRTTGPRALPVAGGVRSAAVSDARLRTRRWRPGERAHTRLVISLT